MRAVTEFLFTTAAILAIILICVAAASSAPPSPVPIPGYTIEFQGIAAGEHQFGWAAYNGMWTIAGPGSKLREKKQQESRWYPGEQTYDVSGLFPGNSFGCGTGLGDEWLEVTLVAGSVRVERRTAFGLIGKWEGVSLGVPLTLTSQGKACKCGAATVVVKSVPDITPYLP